MLVTTEAAGCSFFSCVISICCSFFFLLLFFPDFVLCALFLVTVLFSIFGPILSRLWNFSHSDDC